MDSRHHAEVAGGPLEQTMAKNKNTHEAPGPAARHMSRASMPLDLLPHGPTFLTVAQATAVSHSLMQSCRERIPKLSNTYRMAPDPDQRFIAGRAVRVITCLLNSHLKGHQYNASEARTLATTMSEVIKDRVKEMGFSTRYKYISLVTIAQNTALSAVSCSHFVWNPNTDNFASAQYKNGDLFASATLYAVYFE